MTAPWRRWRSSRSKARNKPESGASHRWNPGRTRTPRRFHAAIASRVSGPPIPGAAWARPSCHRAQDAGGLPVNDLERAGWKRRAGCGRCGSRYHCIARTAPSRQACERTFRPSPWLTRQAYPDIAAWHRPLVRLKIASSRARKVRARGVPIFRRDGASAH